MHDFKPGKMSLPVPWKIFVKGFSWKDLEANKLETTLQIQIDNNLNFENHVKFLCSKASKKLGALQRISNVLDTQMKSLLFDSIIKVQLTYCPFVCLLKTIKFSNEQGSWNSSYIFFDDHSSSYSEFIMTKNQPIHQQNISVLTKEIYKFEKDIFPLLIDMFQDR